MPKLRSARTFLMGNISTMAMDLSVLSNYGVGK
jgi:hypothetical protein